MNKLFQNILIFIACFCITTFCSYVLGYFFGWITLPFFNNIIINNLAYTNIQIQDIPKTIGTLTMIVYEPITVVNLILSLLRRKK